MVSGRRGVTKLGCLFSLLVLTAIAYFAVNIGDVYYRYYRFRDAIRQEARFASRNSDEAIRRRLRSVAEELGLPEQAGRIHIRRSPQVIIIWSEYSERVELPLIVRDLDLTPTGEGDP